VDGRFLDDAALGAVKAWEAAAKMAQAAGRIRIAPAPDPEKLAPPIVPVPVPGELRNLQSACDAFVRRLPRSPRAPAMAYKAAEIDYRHLDFAKARPRFEAILDAYCGEPVGLEAGRAILASHS